MEGPPRFPLPLGARQWVATATLEATSYVGDNKLFLLGYALRALRVLVLLSIWRTVLEARPEASPMPLAALLTYTLVAEVFANALQLRTTLAGAMWQGTLVHYFLRPAGVVRQIAAETSGRWAIDFVFFSLPLLALSPLLGVDAFPSDLEAALLFIPSLALAIAVGLAVELIFGLVALAFDQPIWLVDWMRRALIGVLAGTLIPLSVLPWGLGSVFEWLPFASTAWAPLAIYTGVGDPLPLMALQLAWALALWPLAFALWRANREKVSSYGG